MHDRLKFTKEEEKMIQKNSGRDRDLNQRSVDSYDNDYSSKNANLIPVLPDKSNNFHKSVYPGSRRAQHDSNHSSYFHKSNMLRASVTTLPETMQGGALTSRQVNHVAESGSRGMLTSGLTTSQPVLHSQFDVAKPSTSRSNFNQHQRSSIVTVANQAHMTILASSDDI